MAVPLGRARGSGPDGHAVRRAAAPDGEAIEGSGEEAEVDPVAAGPFDRGDPDRRAELHRQATDRGAEEGVVSRRRLPGTAVPELGLVEADGHAPGLADARDTGHLIGRPGN